MSERSFKFGTHVAIRSPAPGKVVLVIENQVDPKASSWRCLGCGKVSRFVPDISGHIHAQIIPPTLAVANSIKFELPKLEQHRFEATVEGGQRLHFGLYHIGEWVYVEPTFN